MVPRMSGTPSPESILPLPTSSAGNVTGTRKISQARPFDAARPQNVSPLRLLTAQGRSAGRNRAAIKKRTAKPAAPAPTVPATRTRPLVPRSQRRTSTRSAIAAPPMRPIARGFFGPNRNGRFDSSAIAIVGMYDLGRRLRKSKICVRPGLFPVANDDQETGVCAGFVGRSGEKVPSALSFARLGSLPSPIHFSTRRASAPSKPRTTTRPPPTAARGVAAGVTRTTATISARTAADATPLFERVLPGTPAGNDKGDSVKP